MVFENKNTLSAATLPVGVGRATNINAEPLYRRSLLVVEQTDSRGGQLMMLVA